MNSPDIQELRKVLTCTNNYFSTTNKTLIKAEELINEMAKKALIQIDEGIDVKKIQFDYDDMYGLVWGKTDNLDEASRTIRRHKDKISECLNNDSELSTYLLESGCSSFLTIEKSESAGGNRALYWFNLSKNVLEKSSAHTPNIVIYKATQLPKPLPWLKPFLEVNLTVWRIFIATVIPLFVLASIVVIVSSAKIEKSLIFVGLLTVIAALLIIFGYRLLELINKGVTKLPNLMTRLTDRNALFVLSRKNGMLKSTVVVYEADCAICGDRLLIENGGKEFHGRYVGKCAIAPQEHVFTFDHVTKCGEKARSS